MNHMPNASLTSFTYPTLSSYIIRTILHTQYSKPCVKRPPKNRQNNNLNDKW